MLLPPPTGAANNQAKLVATLILCSPWLNGCYRSGHRQTRPRADRLLKICLRECSWL